MERGLTITNSANANISGNLFDMEYQTTSSYTNKNNKESVAIWLNNSEVSSVNYSNPPLVNITDNKILHSKVGIQTDFAFAAIERDTIMDMNNNMNTPFPCGGPFFPPCVPTDGYAIRAMNDAVIIKENKVENDAAVYIGSQPSTLTNLVGISLENALNLSADALVNCNKVENTGIGLRFVGDCGTGTTVERNTMQDHYFGFVLKNNGLIGDVGSNGLASDNEWKGTDYDFSKTFSDDSDGSLSLLYVQNASVNSSFDPLILSTHATTNFIRISKDNTGNLASSGCTAPLLVRQPSDPKDRLAQQKSGGIANGNAWGRQLSKGNKSKYVFAPDSMLMLNQQLLFRQLMQDTSLMADTLLRSFADSMKATPNGKLYNRSRQLGRSTASNNFEANLILINPILKKINNDSTLSSSQVSDLLLVAAKCPFYDGIAVYQARSALYQKGFPMISNPCESTSPIQRNQKRLSAEEESKFLIYPNPTKEIVNIYFEVKETDEIYFELYDAIGRKISMNRLVEGRLNTLSLQELKPGILIYRITINNSILESGKLVIE